MVAVTGQLCAARIGTPVAVPEKISALPLILDFFDRGHSLYLPLAALGLLPVSPKSIAVGSQFWDVVGRTTGSRLWPTDKKRHPQRDAFFGTGVHNGLKWIFANYSSKEHLGMGL